MLISQQAPEGVGILPAIIGSDATHVTNFSGDGKMHPVYVSSGHIHAAARNRPSLHAFILVGYIPVCKFLKTSFSTAQDRKTLPGRLQARLHHQCMSIMFESVARASKTPVTMLDCYGNKRRQLIHPAAIIGDLEEHRLNSALQQMSCFCCEATQHQFGDARPCRARTCKSLQLLLTITELIVLQRSPFLLGSNQCALNTLRQTLGNLLCNVLTYVTLQMYLWSSDHSTGWSLRRGASLVGSIHRH
jgi:hypothetical protein